MNQPHEFKGLIKALGRHLNQELVVDEDNICTLTYGKDRCLCISPCPENETQLLMAGPVFTLTQDPYLDYYIYQNALELAFMGAYTFGCTLGLANQGTLILGQMLPYETCDEALFDTIVEDFVHVCDTFSGQLVKNLEPVLGKEVQEPLPPGGVIDYV